jgi:uncharacterized cupredoxin-like copper-binding protein
VLAALSTGHKIGLLAVAGVFIVYALSSSFLFPRLRPNYPGRGLGWFVVVTVVIFLGMLSAVEFFGREATEVKAKAATAATTPAGGAKTVQVSETEFKITLPSTALSPGSYTFDLKNEGKIGHDLTIDGPGVSNQKTPIINGGQTTTLKVTLQKGTYDFYCSVPGHKQAGMDVKVAVS